MSNQLTQLKSPPNINREDYFQSANSLFHFMKEADYLHTALSQKALIPRYCREDISFLKLNIDGTDFNEIAVLQKCFCDIPLHNITSKLPVNFETEEMWSNDHTKVYGEFAIAFSKPWGELKYLQPVHYINDTSSYSDVIQKELIGSLNSDELSSEQSDSVLYRLSLMKPLRGDMARILEGTSITKSKNFHDEQEWRYVPSPVAIRAYNTIEKHQIQPIIANPNTINLNYGGRSFLDIQSEVFTDSLYRDLWLAFDYNDIRYLIVPNSQARIDLITYILNLSDSLFNQGAEVQIQKSVLISKILVLDEIRKDW